MFSLTENEQGKIIGVVFDVSLRHTNSGERLLDLAKKELIKVAMATMEDEVDGFYLHHPEIFDCVYRQSHAVSDIANYETDGYPIRLFPALKQTVYVLGAEDFDHKKILIIVSDRMKDFVDVRKAVSISRKEMIDCKFIVVLLNSPSEELAAELQREEDVYFVVARDPLTVGETITEEIKNGQTET